MIGNGMSTPVTFSRELPISTLERVSSRDVKAPKFNFITPVAITLDYLSILTGSGTGLLLYQLCGGAAVSNELLKVLTFSVQYCIAFVLFGRIHYLYSQTHSMLHIRETAGVLRVSCFCLTLLSVGIFFSKMVVPRLLLLLSWAFITLFLLLQKHMSRRPLAELKAQHIISRRVLIVGSGPDARRVFSHLLNSPHLRLEPVGFFEGQDSVEKSVIFSHDYRFAENAPVYGGSMDAELLQRLAIEEIFIADETLSPMRLQEWTDLAKQHSVSLSFVGSARPHLQPGNTNVREMDGLVISSHSPHIGKQIGFYEITKRLLDVVGSLGLIALSLPLWIIIPIWIKISSQGPVFFKQERIGGGGVPFGMYKFRSMYTNAPKYGRSPEDARDPRITPAGRFLRRSSMDELPQLLNVLRGEMTLVGPRPEMPYVVKQYNPHQAQRLDVKQGLTGLWQLSADRKFAIHESIEYDLYYLENRGFFLDLAVLLHTVVFAMKGI